jgi:hypothetical protein
MVQCVNVDASSSIKLLSVACVLGPSWTVMPFAAVQYENIDDETKKERANDESDSSLSWQATFHAP